MIIKVMYDDDVVIFHEGKRLGAIDYDTFCLQVLSPRQFRRLEKDPDVRVWDVRKLELVNALLS
jgi:hypothetical protein